MRVIECVSVWAPSTDKTRALVSDWRPASLTAEAAPGLASAVAVVDIVSCATLATEPLVRSRWLAPGSHLDLTGGYTPAMREANDESFRGASVHVDTEEALAKSGDLLGPLSRGVFPAPDLRGSLATLARGEAVGRRDTAERTVFKLVGTALENLAAAMLAVDGAQ